MPSLLRGDRAEAVAAVTPGDGVLPAGGDATARTPLRRAGERLRALDVAVMAAAGITDVTIRAPRLRIAARQCRDDAVARCRAGFARALVTKAGGAVLGAAKLARRGAGGRSSRCRHRRRRHRQRAARCTRADSGAARPGRGAWHCHFARAKPRRSVFAGNAAGAAYSRPARCCLAVWLLIGRHLVAKLAGGSIDDPPAHAAAQAQSRPRPSG